MHLADIPDMEERFQIPVGLSDHSEGSLGAVVGVSLGACVVEKHVCLPGVDSPDSKFSMQIEDFAQMVQDVRNARRLLKKSGYKLTEGEKKSTVFRRSIFAVKDIKEGEIFTDDNLRVIRPGYGVPPKHLKELLGRKSRRFIPRGEPIKSSDLE